MTSQPAAGKPKLNTVLQRVSNLLSVLAFLSIVSPLAAETTSTLNFSIRDLGPQFTTNTAGVMGHDCAYSIPLPDGRALWLFGDTNMEDRESTGPQIRTGKGMIWNCMATVPRQNVEGGIQDFEYALRPDGQAKAVIEFLPDESRKLRRLWPMHGIAFPHGEQGGARVVIFYTMVEVNDDFPPPGNIKHLGTGIATATIAKAGDNIAQFDRLTNAGEPILWGPGEPCMGSAVLRDHHDPKLIWVYATLPGVAKNVIVARTTEDQITTVAGFEFCSGGTSAKYTKYFRKAKGQFDGVPTEMSVTWSPALEKYLAIHTVMIYPDVLARTADSAVGPWSQGTVIYTAKPVTGNPKTFFYAAKEHVELARDNGNTTYITYVDSEEYWPRMLELTWSAK